MGHPSESEQNYEKLSKYPFTRFLISSDSQLPQDELTRAAMANQLFEPLYEAMLQVTGELIIINASCLAHMFGIFNPELPKEIAMSLALQIVCSGYEIGKDKEAREVALSLITYKLFATGVIDIPDSYIDSIQISQGIEVLFNLGFCAKLAEEQRTTGQDSGLPDDSPFTDYINTLDI